MRARPIVPSSVNRSHSQLSPRARPRRSLARTPRVVSASSLRRRSIENQRGSPPPRVRPFAPRPLVALDAGTFHTPTAPSPPDASPRAVRARATLERAFSRAGQMHNSPRRLALPSPRDPSILRARASTMRAPPILAFVIRASRRDGPNASTRLGMMSTIPRGGVFKAETPTRRDARFPSV